MKKIIQNIDKPSIEAIEDIAFCDTAFLSDYMGKYGAMDSEINPLSQNMKLCGPAITCLGSDRDVRREAINICQKGDVLIVAAGGNDNRSCFGGTTARQMKQKGISGIVIDGSTRDKQEICEARFPTFVKGVTPRNYHYPNEPNFGAVNIPVVCAGILVTPGDVIVGDADGIVVVPYEIVVRESSIIREKFIAKKDDREDISNFKGFDVRNKLIEQGYKYV